VADEILEIYILNLLATVAMFAVQVFCACLEPRNYRLMWKELESIETHTTMWRIV
jgi:hypothetical protein